MTEAETETDPRKIRDLQVDRLTASSSAMPLGGIVFDCADVNVYYGKAHALKNVSMEVRENAGDRVHRALGLRQEHVHPLLRPDERPHSRRAHRRHHPVPRARPLRRRDRPGRGAQADRHGLPEAEPVPEVDLRQHRIRATRARPEGRPRRACRAGAQARRAVGRGQGQAQGQRLRPLGRSAAAALHRAVHRGRPGRHPHGRALLGARSDLDGRDRGSDRQR